MTGEVNRVPSGLLGYLDMKARGQNPRLLDGNVSASVDLDRWYEQQQREIPFTLITPAGVGFVGVGTVPQGQLWILRSISAYSTAALLAATTIRISACLQLAAAAGNIALCPVGEQLSFTVGERIAVGWVGSYVLRPGDAVGYWVSQYTVGTAPQMRVGYDITPVSV